MKSQNALKEKRDAILSEFGLNYYFEALRIYSSKKSGPVVKMTDQAADVSALLEGLLIPFDASMYWFSRSLNESMSLKKTSI